jgi:ferredoxin-type protein NapH
MIKKISNNLVKTKSFFLPVFLVIIFTALGGGVSIYNAKLRYFFLFSGIGIVVAMCEIIRILFPKNRQMFRRITQALIGGGLFFGLSLRVAVNFQFSEIIFDTFAFIAAAALIQFIIARLIMPFIFGNAFCSWACWDGAVFELAQNIIPKPKSFKKRSPFIALSYIAFIVLLTGIIAHYSNPALNDNARWWWIIGENIVILSSGIILSILWGSRAYCRLFCPFITISGLISKYSIFKITPVKPENCISCNKCDKACPMLIEVSRFVKSGKRINNRTCIVCERCVSSCNKECLKLTPGLPWR